MESKFVMMQDMELQKACIAAGAEYVEKLFGGLKDEQVKAYIQQAVGAGYSKGWRDREYLENEREKQ